MPAGQTLIPVGNVTSRQMPNADTWKNLILPAIAIGLGVYAFYKSWFDRAQKRSERAKEIESQAKRKTYPFYGIDVAQMRKEGITEEHVRHLTGLVHVLVVESDTALCANVRSWFCWWWPSAIIHTIESRDFWTRIFEQEITLRTWRHCRAFHSSRWRVPIDGHLLKVHSRLKLPPDYFPHIQGDDPRPGRVDTLIRIAAHASRSLPRWVGCVTLLAIV